ncbi:right-handed parallel beta-helix repeat-containing protein, partial [candidate division KSB1 bacterium]|nr:right-handed parallel beta-helix repeat-containing protein [candidate division KSB1 bacterium]
MKARITLLILLATGLLSQVNASILTVTNTLDSGAGSFRQAIVDAGFTAGPDTVLFQIPQADAGYQAAEGIWVIQPITLFILDDDNMFVDGTSQAEFIGSDTNPLGPEIVIDGSISTSEFGIGLDAQSIQIRHLVIHGFESVSISVSDNNCLVAGCYVGTDHTGAHKVTPGSITGIHISWGDNNIIGGASAADRNIISGNRVNGIDINRSKGNQILNNVIGLNATGSDTLGNNTGINIFISTMNTIGPGNIISGNAYHGITLASDETDSNLVIGNYIGTDFLGSSAMPNQANGINLYNGDYNIIGGNTAETRNVISGNGSAGILIDGAGYNEVYGNYIGTDQTGMAALPNEGSGVKINASQYNQIGLNEAGYGNLISGNSSSGLQLTNETSEGNICAGNLIGTDITGANGLPNEYESIRVHNGAHDNTFGPGNIIAFSLSEGINMWGSTTLRNTITQNSFHSNTDKAINLEGANLGQEPPVLTAIASVTGTATPNATVEIFSTPDDEALTYEGTVTADGEGNFYWPGSPAGPYVTATATDLEGNTSELSSPRFAGLPTVTTTADTGLGSLRWAIDIANTNSGPDTITFNISDADPGYDGTVWNILPLSELPMVTDSGTVIDGRTQTQNQGNTNPDGPEIMLNGQSAGEYAKGIKFNSPYNVLTGFVVSGFDDQGVYIASTGGHHNHVFGNYIGTSANGQEALPNDYGVYVGYNAVLNTIGGSSEDEMNLISGNIAYALYLNGSSESLIVGNRIGTTRDGLAPLPNGQAGIYMAGTWENRIGGSGSGEGNLISGNGQAGIEMSFGQSSHNLVQGNWIGTDITGEALIPNSGDGIRIRDGANINRIGGESEGEGNVICGNSRGVQIEDADSDGNQIIGNFIGTDQTGTLRLPNEASGIYIENGAQSSQIGPGNIIRSNMWAGVDVIGETTLYHT